MFFLILLSAIPSVFWLWIYWREDKLDPEPRSLLLRLFSYGILAGLAGLISELAILYIFFDSRTIGQISGEEPSAENFWATVAVYAFIAPLVEEWLKYLVIIKIGFPSKYFNQIIDGVIYAVTAALGFALFENFLYFAGSWPQGVSSVLGVFVLRMLLSTLLHSLSTGWLGYFLGQAKFHVERRAKLIPLGFILAVAIHAIFNFFMIVGLANYAAYVMIVLVVLLFEKIRTSEAQMFWRLAADKSETLKKQDSGPV